MKKSQISNRKSQIPADPPAFAICPAGAPLLADCFSLVQCSLGIQAILLPRPVSAGHLVDLYNMVGGLSGRFDLQIVPARRWKLWGVISHRNWAGAAAPDKPKAIRFAFLD